MPYFRSFDGELIEYEHRKGRKRALVFLPALGFDATYWGRQIGYFSSRGFGVVAIRLRGCNPSRTGLRNIALEDHVRDVQLLLKGLHVARPVVIGASFGGVVAAACRASFPVKKCICINTPFICSRGIRGYIRVAGILLKPLARLDFVKRSFKIDFGNARNTNNIWLFFKAILKFNSWGVYMDYACLVAPRKLPRQGCITIVSVNDEVLLGKLPSDYLVSGNHNCAISSSREVNRIIEKIATG